MLTLEIYDRNKTVYSYILLYEHYKSFKGKTREQYVDWIEAHKKMTPLEKLCAVNRIDFALDRQFPDHFYKFVKP